MIAFRIQRYLLREIAAPMVMSLVIFTFVLEAMRRNRFDGDLNRLQGDLETEAKRLNIEADDMGNLFDRFKAKVRERRKDDGSIDLSKSDIREIAKETKAEVDRMLTKAQERLKRKRLKESRADTKRKAAKAKQAKKSGRRSPPRGRGRKPAGKGGSGFKDPEGADPLDAFVDNRLEDVREVG
jgi:hypothetical protein